MGLDLAPGVEVALVGWLSVGEKIPPPGGILELSVDVALVAGSPSS